MMQRSTNVEKSGHGYRNYVKTFFCVRLEECHAVDEIMVPFKGKSHPCFYMPAKAHK